MILTQQWHEVRMWVEQRIVLAAPLASALLSPRPPLVTSTTREAMGS